MFGGLGGKINIDKINSLFLFASALSLMGIIASSLITQAATAPPNIISYQGRLFDANGSPVAFSTANMQFRFYNALSDGTCLYSNDDSACATDADMVINLTDGLFSTNIGDTGDGYAAIDPTVFGDNASVYLEVEVGGEVLTPRRPFTAAPYALNAHTLDGLTTAELAADLDSAYSTDSDKILSVSSVTGLLFDLDSGDFAIRDSGNTPIFTFGSNGSFTASIADGQNFSVQSDGDTTAVGGLFSLNGSSSTDNYTNLNSYFSATDDTSADTVRNLWVQTQSNDALDTIYSLQVTGADSALDIPLTALGLFENLESGATLADGLIVNGTGVITDALDVSDTDIVNGVNLGGNNLLFDTLNFNEGTSGTLALTDGTDELFTVTNLGSSRVTSKLGLPTSTPPYVDSVTLDIGAPNLTFDGHISLLRTLPFTQTFTDFGVFYSGTGALNVNQFLAPTFDFGFTGSSGETSTVYIDGAPNMVGGSLTARALYVETGLVQFGNSLSVGNSASDRLTVTGSVYIDDNNATSVLRLGASFLSFTPRFQILDATDDYAGIILNDGNNDNRQGLLIRSCAYSNPTGACNFMSFQDGDGTTLGAIEGNGAGGVTNASSGSDHAELFPGTLSDFGAGEILALDTSGNVVLAEAGNIPLGVFSASPNTLGNWQDDWRNLGTLVPVGLLGQLPVYVTNDNGNIQAGDAIAIYTTPGIGAKAIHTGMVLGYALESWSGVGKGQIQVFVRPGFFGGEIQHDGSMLAFGTDVQLSSTGTATASTTGFDSNLLTFRGSGWNGLTSSAESVGFSVNTIVDSADSYRLSYRNSADAEVAYLTESGLMHVSGDVVVGGKFFPSDRGVAQTDKYIYYDGSAGPGGDFIRTNASGWSTGSYDFAEMFPAEGNLEPGDLVAFATGSAETVKKAGTNDTQQLAGIVSTRPGFLAGENNSGDVPVALSGRVPTKVTNENGEITIGDPLTISSTKAGYAMKATQAGQIVGYALEPMNDKIGLVTTFVRVGYFSGVSTGIPGTTSIASELSPTKNGVQNLSILNMEGDIFLQGNNILNVGRLVGLANAWSIESDGTIKTSGSYIAVLKSFQNEDVEVAAVLSPDQTIMLTGEAVLSGNEAVINFEDISPTYNDVISTTAPIRVVVTPHAPVSLYVSAKDHNGFSVQAVNPATGDVSFDWMVVAYRSGFEPVEVDSATETPTEENIEPDVVINEAIPEVVLEDPVIEETPDENINPEETPEIVPEVIPEVALPETNPATEENLIVEEII